MKFVSRSNCLAVLLICSLLIMWSPAGAASPSPKNESARETVKRELIEDGISAEEADKIIGMLSEEDISVLAENTEMIEFAGDEDAQDFAAGIIIIIFVTFVLIAIAASAGGA